MDSHLISANVIIANFGYISGMKIKNTTIDLLFKSNYNEPRKMKLANMMCVYIESPYMHNLYVRIQSENDTIAVFTNLLLNECSSSRQ